MNASAASVENWLGAQSFGELRGGLLVRGEIVDEWRVEAYLGRGLSAEVYRVTNVRFGHDGALKLLVDGSRGLAARFATEADALRFLSLRALPRFMGCGTGFAAGERLHAIVLDDTGLPKLPNITMRERLLRAVYRLDDRHIRAVYSEGVRRI